MLLVVLDTNVLVAGLRSRNGASFAVLQHVVGGRVTPVVNLPLAEEYREVLNRPGQRAAHGLSEDGVATFVDALLAVGHVVATRLDSRVVLLRDPTDGVLVEAALDGGAAHLVTHNRRHFDEVADLLSVIAPADLLRLLAP